tara:strand:- start:57 stop:1019 length:963 start_codon:yes stop_codon:yes gene_type:complete
MSEIFKEVDLKDLSDIHVLKSGSKIVELYGEIHNKEISRNNSYINMVPHINYQKPLVLLEHSDVLCNLEGLNPEKIEYMLTHGGSETIFLKLMEKNYKKMQCVDNRLRLGLLPRFQTYQFEHSLINSLQLNNITGNIEIALIIPYLVNSMAIISNKEMRDYFKKSVYEKFYAIYSEILGIQLNLIISLFKKTKDNPGFFDESILKGETNGGLFVLTMLDFITNIERFGSMVMDINTLAILSKSRSTKIIMYLGINHSNRISGILSNNPIIMSRLDSSIKTVYELSYQLLKGDISLEESLPLPTIASANQEMEKHVISKLN